jgi:hypothetical protein
MMSRMVSDLICYTLFNDPKTTYNYRSIQILECKSHDEP